MNMLYRYDFDCGSINSKLEDHLNLHSHKVFTYFVFWLSYVVFSSFFALESARLASLIVEVRKA